MADLQQHYVVFHSAGSMFDDATSKPIDSWDVEKAREMFAEMHRRGHMPYGFRFVTRGRKRADLDAKNLRESKMYFVGGTVETLAEIEARGDKKDATLIRNTKAGNLNKVWRGTKGGPFTKPLLRGDKVLPELVEA